MGFQVGVRIDRGARHAHFIVNVRGGGAASFARPGDDFSTGNSLAGDHVVVGEVAIVGLNPIAVIEDDQAPVPLVGIGKFHLAASSRENRGADGYRDIDSGMKAAVAVEGVEALAEETGQVALDGPEAGPVFEHVAGANGAGGVEGIAEG